MVFFLCFGAQGKNPEGARAVLQTVRWTVCRREVRRRRGRGVKQGGLQRKPRPSAPAKQKPQYYQVFAVFVFGYFAKI